MYKIFFTKNAIKDIPKLKASNLDKTVKKLLDILRHNPYQKPPPYEKLVGNFKDLYSRRINLTFRTL